MTERTKHIVAGLRRGALLSDFDKISIRSLAEILHDSGLCDIVDVMPTGEVVGIKVTPEEHAALKERFGTWCHFDDRVTGRADI